MTTSSHAPVEGYPDMNDDVTPTAPDPLCLQLKKDDLEIRYHAPFCDGGDLCRCPNH